MMVSVICCDLLCWQRSSEEFQAMANTTTYVDCRDMLMYFDFGSFSGVRGHQKVNVHKLPFISIKLQARTCSMRGLRDHICSAAALIATTFVLCSITDVGTSPAAMQPLACADPHWAWLRIPGLHVVQGYVSEHWMYYDLSLFSHVFSKYHVWHPTFTYFLGCTGHQKWPEALSLVSEVTGRGPKYRE